MNTYVMGEIAVLLAVTALAGILIGWCIKSLMSSRLESSVRADVARDVDEAAADVEQMRLNLQNKESDLQGVMLELQQLRGRDVSLSAGNSTQVEEINNLKVELSQTRQTLDRNRSEFAAFRNEKIQELQSVSNELATFKSGGSVNDKRMNEAHDSIAALRAAARENDAIIESLRARIREADTTVENLRSQLKQAEGSQRDAVASSQHSEKASARLNAELQEIRTAFDKQKRSYDTMLETKNREIGNQLNRLEELGSVQSLLQNKEHEFTKLNNEVRENARNTGVELGELKRKVEESEKALADSRAGVGTLQEQVASLTRDNKTQLEKHQTEISELRKQTEVSENKMVSQHKDEVVKLRQIIDRNNRDLESVNTLKTQVENKNAEVVALNDMLRDISDKRNQSVETIRQLESQATNAAEQAQLLAKSEQQMTALANALKQKETDYAKLRGELEAVEANRDNLTAQVRELESLPSKLESAETELESLRSQKRTAEEAQGQVVKLNTAITNYELELKNLRSIEEASTNKDRQITNLDNSLKQRDAEIQKLRSTGDNLSALNSEVATLGVKINKRETDLTDAQLRVKNLTASLKARDEEIRSLRQSQQDLTNAQQQIDQLNATLKQRDTELQKMQAEMTSVTTASKKITAEVESLKSQQSADRAKLQSTDVERKAAYDKLQSEFAQIKTTRDNYEKRVHELQGQLDEQKKQFDISVKEAQSRTSELEPQLSNLRTQHASLNAEKKQLQGDYENRLKGLQSQLDEQKKQFDTKINEAQSRTSELEPQLNSLKSQHASLDAEKQRIHVDYEKKLKALQLQLEEKQKHFDSKIQETQSRTAELEPQISNLKTQHATLSTEKQRLQDDYEKRVKGLQSQLEEQRKQFDTKTNTAQARIAELEPQVGNLQTKLASLGDEKQRLTANLSNAEALKLKLTEREADLRKLQIELQEASNNQSSQIALQDQSRKVDSLTAAMRDRDSEISRLNKIITENRVGNKQHTSEVNLLKEEIGAQSTLIRSLEEQAENTLTLHKKVATQSTEIESLRADLHSARNQQQQAPRADQTNELAQLKQQITARDMAHENATRLLNNQSSQLQSEIVRLRSELAQKDAELNKAQTTAPLGFAHTISTQEANRVAADLPSTPANPGASAKPRVFVRDGNIDVSAQARQTTQQQTEAAAKPQAKQRQTNTSNTAVTAAPASTTVEGLAGTQMPAQGGRDSGIRRAHYTGDGYRLKRSDGLDDLALLPGLNNDLANLLRQNDVRDFEQVALWTRREIAHFADRLGISVAKAETLNWPGAAKEILAGQFRVDVSREAEKN